MLLRCPAAIDNNVRPGNETGTFGAQIESQLANLLDLSPTANRDSGNELLVEFRASNSGAFISVAKGPLNPIDLSL